MSVLRPQLEGEHAESLKTDVAGLYLMDIIWPGLLMIY